MSDDNQDIDGTVDDDALDALVAELPDVPQEVKERRNKVVLDLQARISHEKLEAWVGREVEVLVEERNRRGQLSGKNNAIKTCRTIITSTTTMSGMSRSARAKARPCMESSIRSRWRVRSSRARFFLQDFSRKEKLSFRSQSRRAITQS